MSCESSIADLTMDMFEDDCKDQLLSHIKELQEACTTMKSAFTSAQTQLESVQGEDQLLREEMESTKTQCQQQSAEILRLMLSLKSEVSSIKEMMQSTQMMQHGLQSTVQSLILERDFLLDELAKTGAISDSVRGRLHSRLSGFGRPSSGSQSTNDSGVALLLEKAHAAFQPHNGVSNTHHAFANGLFGNGNGGYRDQDSLSDHQSHIVSPHVHDYLNALNPSHHHHHNNGEPSGYSSFNTENGPGAVYDSDSSLTLAATKSLSLSNSLSKQCGLELDQEDEKNRARHESNSDLPTKGLIQNAMRVAHGSSSCNSDEMGTDNNNGQISFKENQRLKVAKELVETERKYCQTLRTIQDTFAQPLKSSGILTIRDINTLFPEEVFDLYEKHCGLLAQLEERISSWKSQPTVGDLLERFTNAEGSDVLRLYTSYVNDFPEVLKTFHKLCRSCGDFTRFLKSCLEHPTCGGLDLGAFLLTPVQRMPRYILLLKQMIKYTDVSHPDYKDITLCLDRLRDYLKRLNDSMEHSFQLVTAQITPQPHDNMDKMVGFSGKNSYPRASISSHSSTGEEIIHKVRYKRSTSVPRNQVDSTTNKDGKGKLKSRSKSDWAVCSNDGKRCGGCNCNHHGHQTGNNGSSSSASKSSRYNTCKKGFERAMSDSDINSDGEEGSLEEKEGRKFPTSKSLHDFNQAETETHQSNLDWTISEPSLCDPKLLSHGATGSNESCSNGTVVRNNVLLRPLTTAQPGRYVARIQRGTESEINLSSLTDGDKEKERKKRNSIRTSLKNIFSLKKRSTRTLQISHPIPAMSTTSTTPLLAASNFSHDGHRSLPEPVVMTHYEPTAPSSLRNRLSVHKTKGPKEAVLVTKYGAHFVDEEGKPCTNV